MTIRRALLAALALLTAAGLCLVAAHARVDLWGTRTLFAKSAPSQAEKARTSLLAAARVDVNHADEAALCALPGVGPVLAGRIAAEREQNGAFYYPEDLLRVSGVGTKKLEQMRNLLLLTP